MKRLLAAALLVGVTACGSDSSVSPGPTAPTTPAPVSATGTWKGTIADSSGGGTMTMVLSQSGTTVSGTITAVPTSGATASGTVSGTLSGSALAFSLNVGFSDGLGCRATASGSAQVTTTSLTGAYSGTNTCSGPFSSGQFTLTKQ